ncbi:hypothetical protein [Aquimarina sp. LLG6339-5]|uniref:hypothetical protein n=1 Tax=Aquimarina sp. LLG6339-5 TaxID=3160830 RepID=UPI00387054FB
MKKGCRLFYFPFIGSVILELGVSFFDIILNIYNPDFDAITYDIEDHISFLYNVLLIFWGRYLVKKSNTISIEKKRWLFRTS